jgi:hypothetical protein
MDLQQVLLTLQARADSKRQPAQYSWEAINQILANAEGNSVDYNAFKAEYDSNPNLKGLIHRFDADGLVIKTKNRADDIPVGDTGPSDVDRMAKRAAAKEIKS